MITMTKVQYPAREEMVIDKRICDLCRSVSHSPENWKKSDHYDKDHVTLEYTTGYSCSDGASLEKTIVDICPDCFKNKLLPWLQSQGVVPRTQEVEW